MFDKNNAVTYYIDWGDFRMGGHSLASSDLYPIIFKD